MLIEMLGRILLLKEKKYSNMIRHAKKNKQQHKTKQTHSYKNPFSMEPYYKRSEFEILVFYLYVLYIIYRIWKLQERSKSALSERRKIK